MPQKSFYYYSTSGNLAWLLVQYLLRAKKNITTYIYDLLDAHNLEEQKELYAKVESDLWTAFTRWLIKYPVFMTMIGVPRSQVQLI